MGRPAPKIGFNVRVTTTQDPKVCGTALAAKAQELDATYVPSGGSVVQDGITLNGRFCLNRPSELFADEHEPVRQQFIEWLTAQPGVTTSEVGPLSEDTL